MNQHKSDYTKINSNKKSANHELYEEVAEALGMDVTVVKYMVSINAKFMRQTIERGAFESFTIPYLGKLKAKLKSVQKAVANGKKI